MNVRFQKKKKISYFNSSAYLPCADGCCPSFRDISKSSDHVRITETGQSHPICIFTSRSLLILKQPKSKRIQFPHPTTVYLDLPSMKYVPDVVTNSEEDLGSAVLGGGWHWE